MQDMKKLLLSGLIALAGLSTGRVAAQTDKPKFTSKADSTWRANSNRAFASQSAQPVVVFTDDPNGTASVHIDPGTGEADTVKISKTFAVDYLDFALFVMGHEAFHSHAKKLKLTPQEREDVCDDAGVKLAGKEQAIGFFLKQDSIREAQILRVITEGEVKGMTVEGDTVVITASELIPTLDRDSSNCQVAAHFMAIMLTRGEPDKLTVTLPIEEFQNKVRTCLDEVLPAVDPHRPPQDRILRLDSERWIDRTKKTPPSTHERH